MAVRAGDEPSICDKLTKMRDLIGFIAALVGLALMCGYLLWAMRDASRRDKNPLLVLIAVTVFFPAGLIAWLMFRPTLRPQRQARF